ncbi:MAG: hypothetical protein IJY56_03855 [Clostridia bacterium]|nr:hypothetical protein [Clostridia bacterium]
MSDLKDICLSVSFALIGGGMINILSPVGWERTVRYITGLFIICCFAVPLAGADFSDISSEFTLPVGNAFDSEIYNEENVLSLTENEMEREITALLADKEFVINDINLELKTENETIVDCVITIWLDNEHISERDSVFGAVNEHFGGEAQIIIKEVEE